MTLYVNACVRKESRTDRLARRLLAKLGEYTELKLCEENLLPLNAERLEIRTKLTDEGCLDQETFKLAHQFANADTIVISAPFWDMNFPALLKTYLENIYVIGIVSKYDNLGRPVGLCRAKKLYYVTTAGGPFISEFSYDYIRALATVAFGIESCELILAENLDIVGNDAEKILASVDI